MLKSLNKVILSSPLLYPHKHTTFSEQQDKKWPLWFISMIILTDSRWGENLAYIFSRFEVLRKMIDPHENPQIIKLWTWSTISWVTVHYFKASTSYWGGWQVAKIIDVIIWLIEIFSESLIYFDSYIFSKIPVSFSKL